MPITGTLAIVAAAAMAGVPLLNGFLSKEMFFAESGLRAVERRGCDIAAAAWSRRWPACSAWPTRRASCTDVFFGPPSDGPDRAAA